MGALGTRGEKLPPRRGKQLADTVLGLFEAAGGFGNGVADVKNVLAREFLPEVLLGRNIALRLDAIREAENFRWLRAERCGDFAGLPDVKRSFPVLGASRADQAVGVESRVKAAFRGAHIPQNKIQHFPRDIRIEGVASDLKRFAVGNRELRLVVKHFFKVRDVPALVGGVAMKAAAQLVAHAAL